MIHTGMPFDVALNAAARLGVDVSYSSDGHVKIRRPGRYSLLYSVGRKDAPRQLTTFLSNLETARNLDVGSCGDDVPGQTQFDF